MEIQVPPTISFGIPDDFVRAGERSDIRRASDARMQIDITARSFLAENDGSRAALQIEPNELDLHAMAVESKKPDRDCVAEPNSAIGKGRVGGNRRGELVE